MTADDTILTFGLFAGALLGALIATGVALMMWERASDRLERIVGARAYAAGRKAERHEMANEFAPVSASYPTMWTADPVTGREVLMKPTPSEVR